MSVDKIESSFISLHCAVAKLPLGREMLIFFLTFMRLSLSPQLRMRLWDGLAIAALGHLLAPRHGPPADPEQLG